MFAVLISWIVILFILFSLGDFLVRLYNKYSRDNENYNILDTTLTGMCFITLLLSVSSLWLPSNHYILILLFAFSIVYSITNRKELYKRFIAYRDSTNLLLSISSAVIILSIAFFISFVSNFYDPEFYHYQNVRWNEEYRAIPGLGNLEDRFGFNSSYLLISAIFSFRFLFGDAIYTIQGLIFTLIVLWAFTELYRSQGNIKYILLLFFLLVLLIWNSGNLDNTSTDIIPLLGSFYYIAKTTLNSRWLTQQSLLACILPVTLITYKLSSAVFCLISLYIIFNLIREKKYKNISFIIAISTSIILFWCVRNVIISGYLIYPLSFIDIFSVDWKVPEVVAILQHTYIKDYAESVFSNYFSLDTIIRDLTGVKLLIAYRVLSSFIYLISILSPFILALIYIKTRYIEKNILVVYVVSALSIITGLLFAPDMRFINGFLFGVAFITICIVINLMKKEEIIFLGAKNAILVIIVLLFMAVSFKNKDHIIYNINENKFVAMLYKPLPNYFSTYNSKNFSHYNLNGTIIYITKEDNNRTFDMLPATSLYGIPFSPFHYDKIQNIKTIELRGTSLHNGFRTKKEYLELFNKDKEKYIKEYKDLFLKRIDKEKEPF